MIVNLEIRLLVQPDLVRLKAVNCRGRDDPVLAYPINLVFALRDFNHFEKLASEVEQQIKPWNSADRIV